MKVNEFIKLMDKVKRFKTRLEQENIPTEQQQMILKIYISELTDRINTELLEVI